MTRPRPLPPTPDEPAAPGAPRRAAAHRSRRQALQHGWRLAAGVAALGLPRAAAWAGEEAAATAPAVTFLDRAAGVAALTQAAGDTYYDTMGLLEIRARMNAALPGVALAEARQAVRAYDAAAVESFSDEERAAIGGVVARMQPLLAERAPLYARTPWSFVKLADRAEGGMPHTRGPHIVLPAAVCQAYVRMQRELQASGTLAGSPRGRNLLVHEQTHVLERADPARFEPLFTEVFGFTRMRPAPSTPWLDAHRVINPDGPDVAWAFALERIGGSGWVMPDVTLPDLAQPHMPKDFRAVAVDVVNADGNWQVAQAAGKPRLRDLDDLPGYHAHFPFPDEDFHPNEIAAVLLAHWILQDVPDLARHALMDGAAAWARSALR